MATSGIINVTFNDENHDATSLDGTCYVNGVATEDVVTITPISTGRYKASAEPVVEDTDRVQLVVAVTLGEETQDVILGPVGGGGTEGQYGYHGLRRR